MYKSYDSFEMMIPHSVPSLIKCEEIKVHGPVKFGQNVSFKGLIELRNDSKSVKEISEGEYTNEKIVL
jgi:hypothetical protein